MWCNGNTADSGSAFGGSSPSIPARWFLRLMVRTGDSQSLNRGSIPLGTKSLVLQELGFSLSPNSKHPVCIPVVFPVKAVKLLRRNPILMEFRKIVRAIDLPSV